MHGRGRLRPESLVSPHRRGQPDLQGTWTNATITPFERPDELAGKPVLTPAEAAEIEKKAAENRVDRPPKPGDVGNYNQVWFDSGTKVVSTRQTSLVVEPPDGRVPVKPSAEAKRDYDAGPHHRFVRVHEPVGPMYHARRAGRLFPGRLQQRASDRADSRIRGDFLRDDSRSPDHPLDGSPHLPATVRQWNGDSRGHWEHNTLVVDTTNFNGKGWISTSAAGGRIKGIPESQSLHLVERFTRVDANTINYELTVDDPEVYTKPWKVAMPLTRDDSYKIYEYACHEGNEAVG